MKIAVVAAGGIGGYLGGLLARAGHEVHFMARGAHLAAIRRDGLHVKSVDDSFVISPAHATDDPAEIGAVDLVLFAVKTYDTERAAALLPPLVGPETVILTFQNGIDSFDILTRAIGREHVIPSPIRIETFVASPGHIEQRSPFRAITLGEMDGALTPRLERIAAEFGKLPVELKVATDMPRPIWTKMLALSVLSGLTTLARTPGYDLFKLPEAREAARLAHLEVVAVARAVGVELTDADCQMAANFAFGVGPGITASMHKDLLNGKRLEIDALSGAIVRLGREKGIATPVHLTIYSGLKPFDRP